LEQIAAAGVRICSDIRRDQDLLDDTALLRRLAPLDEIDRRLGALDDREIVGFVSGSVLEEISAGTATTASELLRQAETLYNTLLDAAVFHIDLLEHYDFS